VLTDFNPLTRPGWDEWGLSIAKAVATRGECTRRRVGAVIISPKTRQIWAGYNGAAPGAPSCLDGACPRGRHYQVSVEAPPLAEEPHMITPRDLFSADIVKTLLKPRFARCACGKGWPCPDTVTPDSSYDSGAGKCIAIHGELQCLLDAGRSQLDDTCVMYVSEKPCPGCEKIIAGYLKRVVWPDGELNF
jgi:dCMP deaminase